MAVQRLHLPNESHNDTVPHVAVAIANLPHGTHTGIVHRDPSQGFLLLEHAFHYDLRNDAPSSEYGWVTPNIPLERARSVAGVCRLIWRRNSEGRNLGFPYALRHDSSSRFDTLTGTLVLGQQGKGLTCATFVLVVFNSCGLPLLDFVNWPFRDADEEWQRKIVEILRRKLCDDIEHVEAVESEIGSSRFRCEEVAGACTVDELPASFSAAEEAGRRIVAELVAYRSSAAQ